MLRRNRAINNQLPREPSDNKICDPPNAPRLNPQSPPALFTRIERKPAEEHPKSSSLGNKFKSRAFHPHEQILSPPPRPPASKSNDYQINNDYYPQLLNKNQQNNIVKASQPNHISHPNAAKQPVKESIKTHSPPPNPNDSGELKDRDSMSTELSKQESNDSKNTLREVKFGGIIPETQQLFLKKREKARSPSILKNSSRNILNNSITSASKERSCSVASTRDRGKQKHKNQHNINHIIKQKYKSILNKLQADFQGKHYHRSQKISAATYYSQKPNVASPFKYKDDIFPPVYSSLFSLKKNKPKIGSEIKWMRLTNLYQEKDIVLAKPQQAPIQIYSPDEGYCQEYFPGTLNCLQNCPRLLQKIFQGQNVNHYGIYLVKIYQESIWKYIIVDDFIPVIKGQDGKMMPAFLNIKSKEGIIDIWPFLLEKAYANYYSSYQALHHGNILDFAEELTGSPSQRLKLKSESNKKSEQMSPEDYESVLNRFDKLIKMENVVAIGEINGDKGYAPITYNQFTSELNWNDPFCQFKLRKIALQALKDTFKAIYVITPLKNQSISITTLRKTRPTLKRKLSNQLHEPDFPSIRSFQVTEPGEYSLALKQRDKRFFHFKQNYGEYIWVRAILLQKQYEDCGFRWVEGQYAKKKSINFTQYLQAGEYWLLIEPEFQSNSPNQLLINLYGPAECLFKRQSYKQQQRVIEKGCLDLAQRLGQLNQINKFICSYNYITETVGFIIQNIINERVAGNVSVIRSIRGLKCKSQILPVNPQFYETITTIDGQTLLKLNEEIQLDIPAGQNFTVVLKMKGGLDSKFFRTFDFGC